MIRFNLFILFVFLLVTTSFCETGSSSVSNYQNLALEARSQGNTELSIELLISGRKLCVNSNELIRIYNSLGSSYHKLTDYHTALKYFDSTYSLLDTLAMPTFTSYLHNNYGLVYMHLEDFKKAIEYYKQASKNIDDKTKGVLYFNIAKCFDYLNQNDEAIKNYKLAYKYNSDSYGIKHYYSLLTALELAEHGHEIMHNLHEAVAYLDNNQLNGLYYTLKNDFEKAELYFEGNYDQLLKLYVKSGQWYNAISTIDSLRSSYISLDSKLFLQKNELLIYKNAIDSALMVDTALAFNYAQKSNGNILREMSGIDLVKYKDSYSYFDFDSTIYLFICKSENIKFFNISADKIFWDKYNGFINSFNSRESYKDKYYTSYITFCMDGNYLFKKLLPVVDAEMLIIPGGRLQYLQFECLPMEIPEDMSMPDFKNINYLISNSLIYYDFVIREYNPPTKGKKFITALAPDSSLKYAFKEVKSLQTFWSNRYFGKNATKDKIKETSILHIAAHYKPAQYKIILFNDTISLNELEYQKRDLVVLSTCKSGDGELHIGEGIFSPSRAFYTAGAESLIESIWDATDDGSYLIMQKFYQQLYFRKDKANSLRTAKLNFLHNCPDHLSHPYYWGNFRVVGNNTPLKLRLSTGLSITLYSIILLLIIIIKKFFRS